MDEAQAVIGVLLPLTGPLADIGTTAEQAMLVALAEINAGGGVNGAPLRLAVRDSQTDLERTLDLAIELIEEDGVEVIMAGIASSIADALLEETVPRDAVVLTGLSGLYSLPTKERAGRFFRTLPVQDPEDAWLTWWNGRFLDEGHRKFLYIHHGMESYGYLLRKVRDDLVARCPDCETEIRGYPEDFDDADLRAAVDGIDEAPPDLIILMGFEPDVLEVLKLTERADYQGAYLLNDLFGSVGPHFVDLLQPQTVRRLRWVDVATGEHGAEYANRFSALHGRASTRSRGEFATYDAIMVAALAMQASASFKGPDVATALFDIANPPGRNLHPFEYARGLDLLADGEDIDYEGIILTDFSELGDNEHLPEPAFLGWNNRGEVVPWIEP